MPTGKENRTQYIKGGDPLTANETELIRLGDLGGKLIHDGKRLQRVKVDSGATSATPTGIVAAKQIAFWKNSADYLVTNDSRFSEANRNSVAGVFPVAITAGRFGFVVQEAKNYETKATGSSWVKGDVAVANSGTDADVVRVAEGTAPTHVPVGVARAAASGGNVALDLNVPEVD